MECFEKTVIASIVRDAWYNRQQQQQTHTHTHTRTTVQCIDLCRLIFLTGVETVGQGSVYTL